MIARLVCFLIGHRLQALPQRVNVYWRCVRCGVGGTTDDWGQQC